MREPLNPLSSLSDYIAPKRHTSGRRELRAEILANGVTMYVRPKSQDDLIKTMLTGPTVYTLPIKRAEPKRGGLSKKEWKRLRKEGRLK